MQFVKLPKAVLERTDLTLASKIVYAMLVDAIGTNHDTWHGIRSIARACGVSAPTVSTSIRQLESEGLIIVSRVVGNPGGKTNRYSVPRSVNKALGILDVQNTERERAKCRAPDVQNTEQNKTKLTRPKNQTKLTCSSADAETIYKAYPRRVAKADAIKATTKAITIIAKRGVADPVAWLIERVRQFADSPAGNAGKFTPHPATWMNAGRYDDDPETWKRDRDTNAPGNNRRPSGPRADDPDPDAKFRNL